jgi:hypothetical protein
MRLPDVGDLDRDGRVIQRRHVVDDEAGQRGA